MIYFQFTIAFVLTVKVLKFLRGITEKIQGNSLDLYNVANQVIFQLI